MVLDGVLGVHCLGRSTCCVKMCRPGLRACLGLTLKISSPFEKPKSQDHRGKQSVRGKVLR